MPARAMRVGLYFEEVCMSEVLFMNAMLSASLVTKPCIWCQQRVTTHPSCSHGPYHFLSTATVG